jgi:hypothetical protein
MLQSRAVQSDLMDIVDAPSIVEDTLCQSGFAAVNVCADANVADMRKVDALLRCDLLQRRESKSRKLEASQKTDCVMLPVSRNC